MRSSSLSTYLLIFSDWSAAAVAWFLFFAFRKYTELGSIDHSEIFDDFRFWEGMAIIPIGWVFLFCLVGSYVLVIHKSVARAIEETLYVALLGSLVLLFLVLVDDVTLQIKGYVWSFLRLWSIHMGVFLLFRFLTMACLRVLQSNGIFAPSIHTIQNLNSEIQDNIDSDIVKLTPEGDKLNSENLNKLLGTSYASFVDIHESHLNQFDLASVARPLFDSDYVRIKVYPLVVGYTAIKRVGDIVGSAIAMIALSPLAVLIAILVKLDSSGSVIFRQKRIGQRGKTFEILKFRTMYEGAEKDGPALATVDDSRCTPFGKKLRRWRMDEIPQFINVLLGHMSIVGPRPERPYYAEKLTELQPQYPLLWRTKPGITSWGQIKYGYASTIDEMLQRFRFDLLYIERMNPFLDMRIIWYTLVVLIQGKGR